MGLLDQFMSSAQPTGTEASGGLLGHVTELVNGSSTGGMAGLVQQFQASGLGGVIGSWIGTGPNQPISAEQLTSALGPERIQAIAAKIGVPAETLTNQLATMLPQVIDRLTPNGAIPQGNLMDQAMAAMRSHLPSS